MGASDTAKVIKRVVLHNPAGEQFRLIARTEGAGVHVHAEAVPDLLGPRPAGRFLDGRTNSVLPSEKIQEEWRGLLESLQSGGWTPHEEFQFTVELSENDGLGGCLSADLAGYAQRGP